MTTIREKIMAIKYPIYLPICNSEVAFDHGRMQALDIAEVEVARLEARVRELEKELALYRMDMRSGGTGS